MKKKSDRLEKEQAFIAAARQELASRNAAGSAVPRPAPAAPSIAVKGSAVAGRDRPAAQPRRPAPTAPTTPIDTPTVDGWNHPAARDAEPKVKIAAEEKWARIAAAMESEQRESRAARERMRRLGRRFAIGATVVILLVIIGVLH